MSEDAAPDDELTYHVELMLPQVATELRYALDAALHRSDRHVGVITGTRDDGLYVGILTGADDADAARRHALTLLEGALWSLGHGELMVQLRIGDVTGRPTLAGGPRTVDAAPGLTYRSAALPDGRVLQAAREGALGDWYAFDQDDPSRVLCGRALPEVLSELVQLPWGGWPAWFSDALAALAGRQTSDGLRYTCPCCDQPTLAEPPPGTYEICGVCGWEDDSVQFRDPDYRGGANSESLREARSDFTNRA